MFQNFFERALVLLQINSATLDRFLWEQSPLHSTEGKQPNSLWFQNFFERALVQVVQEFSTFIDRNRSFIPNYGERYRHGERISTGFVESTVNQVVSKRMVKQQQMRWTQQGAHLLLKIRTQALNGDLHGNFCRWYPGMERDSRNQDGMAAAA